MKKIFFIIYFLFLLSFAIFSYIFIDPNLFYLKSLYSGFAFQSRLPTAVAYIIFVFLFFAFYFFFLWQIYKKQLDKNGIKWLIGISLGILFFSYPAMLSYDIFNYIFTSKVLFFYHENPYIIMPIEFIGDPLLLFTHAANKIALYGPMWILLTGIPYLLGFGNFLLTLFAFKLLIIFFYLATIFLIWKLSKNLFSVAVFSLNPLVIMETLFSGHNDVMMMFLALLSFYLLKKNRIFLAILFILFSIFIKYATIFLLPLFLYVLWNIKTHQKIIWTQIWLWAALSMFVIFLLSPLREEIYPWYFIWPFTFIALRERMSLLLFIALGFSFGLCFRIAPFIYTGSWAGITPLVKILVTFLSPLLFSIIYVVKKKI